MLVDELYNLTLEVGEAFEGEAQDEDVKVLNL
jgi:hypothetical protein